MQCEKKHSTGAFLVAAVGVHHRVAIGFECGAVNMLLSDAIQNQLIDDQSLHIKKKLAVIFRLQIGMILP